MNYVLANGKVFFEDGFKNVDIEIENGIIKNIGKNLNCEKIIDCKNKIISPGFIDVHVHMRSPGQEHKEDISSATHAAIKGGYTTIFTMPNTSPVIDNSSILNKLNDEILKSSYCNVLSYVAISKGLLGMEATNIKELSKMKIAGFSDDGKGIQDDELMLSQLREIEKTNHLLSIHCEDENELGNIMGSVNLGEVSNRLNLIGINNLSESNMLNRDLKLIYDNKLNIKYHMCHISTTQSIEAIKKYKKLGVDVSVEVSPHHLVLNERDIKTDNPNYKMNPPLRSKVDHLNLLNAFNSGIIDIIATDHAPHSELEKAQHISSAPFGIIGLEQSFSVLNTFLIKPSLSNLNTILNALTYNPAKRFNVTKRIAVGEIADLCVIDVNQEHVYTKENTSSKSINTPFNDVKLQGKITTTIIKNKIYDWGNNEKEISTK